SPAQDIINLSLTGSFLPFERTYVTILTKRGTRLGPFKLAPLFGTSGTTMEALPGLTYTKEADLLQELRTRRNAGSGDARPALTLSAQIFLPNSLGPNDVIGFEVT